MAEESSARLSEQIKELVTESEQHMKAIQDQIANQWEAQQKAIDRNPRMPFYNLNIDAGALWARRKIDGMLRSEQGQSVQAPGEAAE